MYARVAYSCRWDLLLGYPAFLIDCSLLTSLRHAEANSDYVDSAAYLADVKNPRIEIVGLTGLSYFISVLHCILPELEEGQERNLSDGKRVQHRRLKSLQGFVCLVIGFAL